MLLRAENGVALLINCIGKPNYCINDRFVPQIIDEGLSHGDKFVIVAQTKRCS